MPSMEQRDRDILQLITNLREVDSIHGSWGADKSADFTVGTLDHYAAYFITAATGGTVIGTLPSAAGNKYRTVTMVKTDSTTGVGKMAGSALSSMGVTWTALYLINRGDALTAQSDGTVWQVKSGPIQPVASEPSLGTPHQDDTAISIWTLSARSETRATPYTWDLAALGLPVGATRVEIYLVGYLSDTAAIAADEITAWDYDAGPDSWQNRMKIGMSVRIPYKPATATAQVAHAGWRGFIQIGPSRKLYIGSFDNNIRWYCEYLGYDS